MLRVPTAPGLAEPICKGCSGTVRISDAQVETILRDYLRTHPVPLADDTISARRLALCAACTDLLYGTTCRHCGCLVAVRARLGDASCPAPLDPRW